MRIRVVILGLVFVIGGLSTNIWAQTNLKKWVEEAQNIDEVDVTIISERNPKTKKLSSSMISINFKNKPELEAKLYDAAKKDRDNADKVIENKRNGKIVPTVYEFNLPNEKYKLTKYIFSKSKNGSVSVVVKEEDYSGG